MAGVFFIPPALKSISDGELFKKVFAIILRLVAIVFAIGAVVGWFTLWGLVFRLGGFFPVVGGIIFQLILVVTIYMVVHTVWIRADTIGSLPKAEFTVIPIGSILLRMTGEIYACFFIPLSIGGGIAMWFGGGSIMRNLERYSYMPPALDFLSGGGSSFLGGLMFMITGVVVAFMTLVFFYLLSELLVVTVDMARNLRATREIAEGHRKPVEGMQH